MGKIMSRVAGTSRSRKVSEGMNPMMTMLGHSESVDQGVFHIIKEESWKGTNAIYGPGECWTAGHCLYLG